MNLDDYITKIPDHPKPGVLFRDITSLLADGPAFHEAIDQMAAKVADLDFDVIIGSEARGFIFGTPLAYLLKKPFVLVRKKGKLPRQTVSVEYDLEYGTATLEMHRDAIRPGQRILIVDDLIATGGTIEAMIRMTEGLGGVVAGVNVLMELKDLGGMSSFMHINAIKRNREIIIPGGDDMVLENDIIYIATTRKDVDNVIAVCGKVQHDVERVLIMGGNAIVQQLVSILGNKYKIKIMHNDLERCQELADMFPDCNVVHYVAGDTDVLEDEGVEDYDVFVAMGESSESNILSCVMAKEMGMRKTIAQVENLQFFNEAESLNIGTIINKKLIASSTIFQMMIDDDTDNAKCLALADAEVAELEVGAGAKVTKAPVKDLKLSRDMTIAGLVRGGVGQLVNGNTHLQAGDRVVVFCLSGAIHKIEKMFG